MVIGSIERKSWMDLTTRLSCLGANLNEQLAASVTMGWKRMLSLLKEYQATKSASTACWAILCISIL
jgi:hypothetical protein